MKKLLTIKPQELPLLFAAVVFFISVVGWLHYQSRSTTAMAATTITLTTLQHALEQYVDITGGAPATISGHRSLYGFLVNYQQRFSHQTAEGQWVADRHSAMNFLRPNQTIRGWIAMPRGGRMRGIVGVTDGFGRRIRYIGAGAGAAHGPCFVSHGGALGRVGHATIYSGSQAEF